LPGTKPARNLKWRCKGLSFDFDLGVQCLKRYQNLIAGFVTVLLAAVIFYSSGFIQKSVNTALGPDFMPKLTAVLMGVLGLALIIREVLSLRKGNPSDAKENAERPMQGKGLMTLIKNNLDIVTLALLGLYAIGISKLGFLLASTLYMIIHTTLMLLNQKRNYLLIVLYSAGFSTAMYYLFVKVLHVMLPV